MLSWLNQEWSRSNRMMMKQIRNATAAAIDTMPNWTGNPGISGAVVVAVARATDM